MQRQFWILQATTAMLVLALPMIAAAQRSDQPRLLAPLQATDHESLDVPGATANQNTAPGGSASKECICLPGKGILELASIGDVKTDIRTRAADNGNKTLPPNKAKGQIYAEPVLAHSFLFPGNGYRGYLAPAAVCYRPLYFEETQLERYGNRTKFQPLASGAKFGLNLVSLPYQLANKPPRHCRVHHHPFETGGVAPHYFEVRQFDRKAALVEAAVITGAILILP